jgi:hypothetical protein
LYGIGDILEKDVGGRLSRGATVDWQSIYRPRRKQNNMREHIDSSTQEQDGVLGGGQ